jgi:hypothetical protein
MLFRKGENFVIREIKHFASENVKSEKGNVKSIAVKTFHVLLFTDYTAPAHITKDGYGNSSL